MSTFLQIQTTRLNLRWLEARDAAFVLRLVNDPAWLRFIGDRDVANLTAAKAFIEDGPRAMYRKFGFGLNRVALRECDTPIGICGLLKRDPLPLADLGYALLPAYRSHGYAFEAAGAVLQHGFEELEQASICAVVSRDNETSIKLLGKLGFHYSDQIRMDPKGDRIDLYTIERKA